jgi:regulator of protease activity HflC (stomatin/prohibitin superfamily)
MGFIVGSLLIVMAAIIGEAVRRSVDRPKGGRVSPWLVLGPTLGLMALITLLTCVTQVGTGEIAVMTRFGRVTGQELTEGIHFKLPTDSAVKYDVKVQKEEAEAEAASADLQDVHSKLALNYSLEPGSVDDIHRRLGTTYKTKVIEPALQEVFKATTSQYNATNLITERPEVKAKAVVALRERLQPFGIRVVDLNITNFSFSPAFAEAIEAKQVAQQNAERARFNLEAAKVDAEAQQVQALTLSELYLQKLFLEKWDGHMPQVVSSGQGGAQTIIDLMTGGTGN